MRPFLTLILSICCLWAAGNANVTGKPIIIDNDDGYYSIGRDIELLEDTDGILSIREVLQLDSLFVPSEKDVPVFGATPAAWWCRFSIKNETEKNWYLHVNNNNLDEADFYIINDNGKIKKFQAGAQIPPKHKFIPTGEIIFPLRLQKGESISVYLRVRTNSILRLPLNLKTLPAIYAQVRTNTLINGLYFGLLIGVMLYNLFVFISIREKTYLYYLFYIFFVGLVTASMHGYHFEFIPDVFTWFNHAGLFNTCSFLFSILFTNSFLQLKKYTPDIQKYSNILFFGIGILLLLHILGYKQLQFKYSFLMSFPVVIYLLTMGILSYKRGLGPALLYLLGYGTFCIGIIITVLKDSGVIPSNMFTEHIFRISSATEAIILSYALAMKLNYFKAQREKLQAQALEQAAEFSELLISNQEHERKRIAAELHDSVGQGLILAKSRVLMMQKNADAALHKQLEQIKEIINDTVHDVRSISYALRPFQLDLLGMTQAIKSLIEDVAEKSGIEITADIKDLDNILSKEKEINIYRIVQECINNILKHSEATSASVKAAYINGHLEIEIKDFGKGINSEAPPAERRPGGFGLFGIQDREKLLNGTMHLEPCQPHGTAISIKIPVYEHLKPKENKNRHTDDLSTNNQDLHVIS